MQVNAEKNTKTNLSNIFICQRIHMSTLSCLLNTYSLIAEIRGEGATIYSYVQLILDHSSYFMLKKRMSFSDMNYDFVKELLLLL